MRPCKGRLTGLEILEDGLEISGLFPFSAEGFVDGVFATLDEVEVASGLVELRFEIVDEGLFCFGGPTALVPV